MLIKSIVFDNCKYSNIPSIVLESGDIIPSSFILNRAVVYLKTKIGYDVSDVSSDLVMLRSITPSLIAGEIHEIEGNALSLCFEYYCGGSTFFVECIFPCSNLRESIVKAVQAGNKIVNIFY